jgi:cytochrome oxidase Cu insertion factor (SCO1/SenC/PrrC family)
MQLSPIPVTSAPGFTLTDQGGQTTSLAGLKGHVVVLEFMDPHCTDICPIVSQEFLDAYRDLGTSAPHVVFLSVNVNRCHLRVADVAAFSSEQRLTQIPAWHFLTGSYPSLQAVWQAYQIQVDAPGPDADVIHSSQMYFIDPQGRERFTADPMVAVQAQPDARDHLGQVLLAQVSVGVCGAGLSAVAAQIAVHWREEESYPGKYGYRFKHMTTVGEPIEPEVWRWNYHDVGKGEAAIVDTWWQTENGG